jgi:hypothetical protein
MRRRAFLAAGAAALAGCGAVETTNGRAPALVADRPDAVYRPTHREGMGTVGRARAGDLAVAVTYSYPHRFWTVENDGGTWTTALTEVRPDDAVHLMTIPFHEPTGRVIPNAGVSVEIARDGRLVSQETVYPMLSQRMGAHHGANFPLDGDGSYEVTVSVGGLSTPRYGAFAGLFDDPATGTVAFDYAEAARNEIGYRTLDDAGERGALSPMSMGSLPVGRVPDPVPGERLRAGSTGDATLVVTRLDDDRFGGPYLAVLAATPYNRLAVPGYGLSATVARDGTTLFDGRLRPSLDPTLGFHYGAPADVAPTDDVSLTVDVPAQVARHEGYETAFLAAGPVSLGATA